MATELVDGVCPVISGTGSSGLSASETAVNAAYREVLLRDPEAAGLPYWKDQIDNGTFTASTLPLAMACAAKDASGTDGTNARAWLSRTGKSCGGAGTGSTTTTNVKMSRPDAVAAVLDAYQKVLVREPIVQDSPGLKKYDGGAYWIKKLMDGSMDAATVRTALSCVALEKNRNRPTIDGNDGLNAAKYRDILGIRCSDFDKNILLDRVSELDEAEAVANKMLTEVLGTKTFDYITPDGFDYGVSLSDLQRNRYFVCKYDGQNSCPYGYTGTYNEARFGTAVACNGSAGHEANAKAWLANKGLDCRNAHVWMF